MPITNNKSVIFNNKSSDIYLIEPKLATISTEYTESSTYSSEQQIAINFESEFTPLEIGDTYLTLNFDLSSKYFFYVKMTNDTDTICIQPESFETIDGNVRLNFNFDISAFDTFYAMYGYLYYKNPSTYTKLITVNQVYKNEIICNNIGIPITRTELGLLPNNCFIFKDTLLSNKQLNMINTNHYIYGTGYKRKCAILDTAPDIVISQKDNKYIYLENSGMDEIFFITFYYEIRNDIYTDEELSIIDEYRIDIIQDYSTHINSDSFSKTENNNNRQYFGNRKDNISFATPTKLELSPNVPYKIMEVNNESVQ